MKSIRVMLIEDHPEYRDVVEMTVNRQPDMELTNKFGSAEIALRSFQEQTDAIPPDVILLDLGLPGMGGLDAMDQLSRCVPQSRVVVLTQSNRESDVLSAISKGAAGYLLKSSNIEQITDAIRAAVSGDASIDSGVARFLVRKLQTVLSRDEINTALTKRELQILSLIGEGFVKKEIAQQLGISSNTVRTHIVHIYEKLNVQNAPAAITKAYSHGILRPPQS